MGQIMDDITDVDKVIAEGLKTDEEIENWALTHGYGPGLVPALIADVNAKLNPAPAAKAAPAPVAPKPVVKEEPKVTTASAPKVTTTTKK